MRLSIVIPCFQEADRLRTAVESAWVFGGDQVIVSDGESDDASRAVAEAAGAEVVTGTRGRGTQIARGVAVADGDVVMVLHADNRLPAAGRSELDRVWGMAESMKGPPGMFWGGMRQRIDDPRWRFRWIETGNWWRARRGWLFGDQAMWVGRELLDQVGGFDDVPMMEDVRLSARLRQVRRPTMLAGPVGVDPRRWHQRGVLRCTLRNWRLLAAWFFGVDEHAIQRAYRGR